MPNLAAESLLAGGECRGLTLYQPWASLVACGAKQIETRARRTSWRGAILIHASKRLVGWKRDDLARTPAWGVLREVGDFRNYGELPESSVLAVARIVSCLKIEARGEITRSARELACGDFAAGRFAWHLEDVTALERPVAANGARGLWFPKSELIAQVLAALPRGARAEPAPDFLADRIAP